MNDFELNLKNLAPVVVFGFNRPIHLQACLESLEKATLSSESVLYIFIDGQRSVSEKHLVDEVERVSLGAWKFKEVNVYRSEMNLGLKKSITRGVDQVLVSHQSIIVVEDDLIAAKGFLLFLNIGLQKYIGISKVASISGYQYPGFKFQRKPAFLKGADCWGWATWKDRWLSVEFNPSILLSKVGGPIGKFKFNIFGSAPYYSILELLQVGKVDSWAISWHASMYFRNKMTLYPPKSLIRNMGADNSGTHSGDSGLFMGDLDDSTRWDFPGMVKESPLLKFSIARFFWRVKVVTQVKNLNFRILLITKRITTFKYWKF